MATIYCRSTDGSNGDDGSTWALAKATLGAAITAAGADGIVYVSQAHSETLTANTTYILADGCRIIAVDDSAEPPTAVVKASDATHPLIQATNGATNYSCGINPGHECTIYGIEFQAGGSYTGTTPLLTVCNTTNTYGAKLFEECKFALNNSSGNWSFSIGYPGGRSCPITFKNCEIAFGAAGKFLQLENDIINFLGCSVSGTAPTVLLKSNRARGLFDGCDLSLVTGTLVNIASVEFDQFFMFRNCKLGSGVALTVGTRTRLTSGVIQVHNCDSGDTNYRLAYAGAEGTINTETTIVRTGGAGGNSGLYNGASELAAIAWKMVTTAASMFPSYPLASPEIFKWNDTVGSAITASVEIVHDSQGAGTGSDFTDEEIWLEVQYLGTAGFPKSSYVSNANVLLSAVSDHANSSETWTTTGLTTPVKQKLSVTFTPQERGYLQAKVYLAKASKTVYVDPMITVS